MRRFSTTVVLTDVICERSRTQACAVNFVFERVVGIDDPLVVDRRGSEHLGPSRRSRVIAHAGSSRFAAIDFREQRLGIRLTGVGLRVCSRIIALGLGALVFELQQYRERLVCKVRASSPATRAQRLESVETSRLSLEFCHDVARLLLPDSRQRLQIGVIAAIDRTCDRRHRLRKRARRRPRTDRRDAQSALRKTRARSHW